MERSEATGPWIAEARKSAGLLVALGVITVVFGVLAIGAPLMTGLAVAIFVGALLLVTGILRIVQAFKSRHWNAGLPGGLLGFLTAICGAVMLFRPMIGLATLTLVLSIYLIVEGIFEIAVAFRMKPHRGWGWMLIGGVITLILGGMIWSKWPLSGVWAIGVLVGLHILFTGWNMVFLGGVARSATDPA